MTAIRKSTPRRSSDQPNVMRRSPLTLSMPIAARPKPSIIEMIVLNGSSPLPMKLQNVSR